MIERCELWEVIRSIPAGRVASYGAVGRALRYPASGRLVGRWMHDCPEEVPWWRVVAKDGRLPIWKVDPNLETVQVLRLREEGVEVVEGRVDMATYGVNL